MGNWLTSTPAELLEERLDELERECRIAAPLTGNARVDRETRELLKLQSNKFREMRSEVIMTYFVDQQVKMRHEVNQLIGDTQEVTHDLKFETTKAKTKMEMTMEELHDMERTGLAGRSLLDYAREEEEKDEVSLKLARNLPKPPSNQPVRVFVPVNPNDVQLTWEDEEEEELLSNELIKALPNAPTNTPQRVSVPLLAE
jgi:hypothetical protein